ncbi:MBL fold metallo-hydrolase [Candidatus Bathyarchaeota archaeon]|nr:MBL fold metallo-hydrolase [Candidatus Bathyarchaeota archaeon]
MRVVLLGTGGPRPDPTRMGPSTLVSVGDDNILVDAGRGVAARLAQVGVPITEVGHIFITHLHFDHTGGLADTLFAAWNKGRNRVINVYGPKGTRHMVTHLLEAYSADIWYRLAETALTTEKLMDIRDMVEVTEMQPGTVYDAGEWRVTAAHVDHGHGLGLTRDEWQCLGYRVEAEGKAVAISGDAVHSKSLVELSRDADLLVMCCYLAGEEIDNHDLRLISRHVLASSMEAGKIASEAGVKSLVLTHIREKPRRLLDGMVSDIKRDYDGVIHVGEDLMEFNL